MLKGMVKKYLQHPDMLFRRVRDEFGQLHLSKRAAAYHPGRGVYRSSYKNARRLAATEINMAYRTADYLRWQDFDFVVGIEINLSSNHTCLGADGKPHPFEDICDYLAGRYPKDFKFVGWHPHCRCYATTILKTEEEMAEDDRRILNGEEPTTESENEVKNVPEQFTKWMEKNAGRIEAAQKKGTLPYFIRDNNRYIYSLAQQPTSGYKKSQYALDYEKNASSWNSKNIVEFVTCERRIIDGKEYVCNVYKTKGGTEIVAQSSLPKSYHIDIYELARALEELPMELKAQAQTINLMNRYHSSDAYFQKLYKGFSHGYAYGGNGTITFCRCDFFTKEMGTADLPRTLSHENGHSFDHKIGQAIYKQDISATKEWQQAQKDDYSISGMESPTAYGKNAPTEDFAESCNFLITHREYFEKHFPQ